MAKVYKAGQVAASLFSKKKPGKDNGVLADLFSRTRKPTGEFEEPVTVEAVKKSNGESLSSSTLYKKTKKRRSEDTTQTSASKKKKKKTDDESVEAEEFPFQHEALIKQKEQEKVEEKKKKKTNLQRKKEDEEAEKRPRRNRKRDKAADTRTIFVGNCPLSADKKVLKRLFKDYGEIETVRFRCAPAADPNLPRRAIVITRNFNDKCQSYISYIVFKEKEAAEKALEKNGFVLDGLHLRVDIASASSKADKKRSVFVGNLPFDIQEDRIRRHFEDCGDIINVRIVRDRQTSLGKGISFVSFESKDSVGLALKLNNSEFGGRKLRVMPCSNKLKKKENKKDKDKIKGSSKKTPAKDTDKKKLSFAPSNATTSKFKTILQTKKEKRMRKIKKKAAGKKTDPITAALGVAPPTLKQVKKANNAALKGKGGTKGKGPNKTIGKGFNKGKKSFSNKGGKHKITSRSKAFKQKSGARRK